MQPTLKFELDLGTVNAILNGLQQQGLAYQNAQQVVQQQATAQLEPPKPAQVVNSQGPAALLPGTPV